MRINIDVINVKINVAVGASNSILKKPERRIHHDILENILHEHDTGKSTLGDRFQLVEVHQHLSLGDLATHPKLEHRSYRQDDIIGPRVTSKAK